MKTIDQVLADKLSEWYVGEWPIGNFILCAIALVLCVILCGAIGIEREKRGRSAGLRTHLLVGVGSCIVMIISIYGFPTIVVNGVTMNRDVARLAAQIVSGIGFLGAGAIIHRNAGTKGLTTAASIWIVMAIGLACGSFNFILALGGTILILLVLTVFIKIEDRLIRKNPLYIVHTSTDSPIVGKLVEISGKHNAKIDNLKTEIDDNGHLEITFYVLSNSKDFSTSKMTTEIQLVEGVKDVQVLNENKK